MPLDSIPLTDFASRRSRLRAALKNSAGLIFSGSGDPHGEFHPHPHFHYLTGITDEPDAILLLDPGNAVESRREMLFLRPLNPEVEKWDGYRMEVTAALRKKTGFTSIFRHDKLPMFLLEAARRNKSVACLHPLAQHTQSVSPDFALFKQLAERVPGLAIEDRSDALAQMRSVKSKNEIAMLQRAIDITAIGFENVLRAIKPGNNEFDVKETIEHTYRTNGATNLSFGTIAGGGFNSTVLHYRTNDQPLNDGDLIVIDSGCKWAGYSADITRTFPINGNFTKRQREVYEVVLAAQMAAIKAIRPGVRIAQIDAAARNIITKAGFGDYFIHGIGHHLGLETHDITPLGSPPLREGCVITIEPGIYIPQERLGVRIEDDVVVTKTGAKVLGAKIPKTVREIEKLLAKARLASAGRGR